MPKIEEYGAPSVESQSPIEVSARPIEEAGQAGRAVARFGQELGEAMEIQHRRESQEEVADVHADFANVRAEWSEKLNKSIQDGSVDTAQILDSYQEAIDEKADSYQTDAGRRAFKRQEAMTRGSLARGAVQAQAQLAGEKAEANYKMALRGNSVAILNDPKNFPEILDAHMAGIDEQVAQGLPAKAAEGLKAQDREILAEAAVQGWINMGKQGPQIAEELLNEGAFDGYLSAASKEKMMNAVRTERRAQRADYLREKAEAQEIKTARAEAWKIKNLERMENNQLSAKEVIDAARTGVLSYADAKEQIAMIERNAVQKAKPNPTNFNNLYSRMLLPDSDPQAIRDSTVIDQYGAQGLISPSQHRQLMLGLDRTPEGQMRRSQKKLLTDFMRRELVKTDKLGAFPDPDGESHMSMALQELATMEAQYRAEGKPVETLYQAGHKDSFYNQVLKYKRNPKQVMQATTERMRMQNDAQNAVFNRVPPSTTPEGKKIPLDQWMKQKKSGAGSASVGGAANPPPTAGAPQPVPTSTSKNVSMGSEAPDAFLALDSLRVARQQKGGEFDFAMEQLGLNGPGDAEIEKQRKKRRDKMKR